MGVSIYYTASRPQPLSPAERAALGTVVARYPVETLLAECGAAEGAFDGEAFCVYPEGEGAEPGVVFEGAAKLPLRSEEAMWAAVGYWCRLLSEVRRLLPGASWRVHVDDYDIPWIEESQAFDPSA